jgi:tripartite-type tricarboxylate transporter receptor subunit TctC
VLAHIDLMHVPYKSGPQAVNGLLGGETTTYFGGIPVQLPLIRAGKLKALATSGAKRSPHLPEVPTIAEAGVQGYEVDVWYALFAPRGTPPATVARISADARKVLLDAANKDRFGGLGVDPVGGGPVELKALLARETVKWAKVVKAAGIAAQ